MYREKENKEISKTPNLVFYQNKIPSEPNGDKIELIHKNWFGDYKRLEEHHGYIQWLFPNLEDVGVNRQAFKLLEEEAKIISKDKILKERVLKSFILMLDFWGMKLDVKSGIVSRSDNYKSRYSNWIGGHNHLRITRTLKSLRDLGLKKYQRNFLKFLLKEINNGSLKSCSSSYTSHWFPTLNQIHKN
eukprot:gene264-6679_t